MGRERTLDCKITLLSNCFKIFVWSKLWVLFKEGLSACLLRSHKRRREYIVQGSFVFVRLFNLFKFEI